MKRPAQAIAWFLVALCAPVLADGQNAGGPQPTAAPKVLAPGVLATTRFSETVEVTRKGAPNLHVRAELATWHLQAAAREIAVPAQGFYVAELRNADIATTTAGKEQVRHAGELWTVPAGQAMIVRLLSPVQQNATLRVLSLSPLQ